MFNIFLFSQQNFIISEDSTNMHMFNHEGNSANVDNNNLGYSSPYLIINDIQRDSDWQHINPRHPTYTLQQFKSLLNPPSIFSQPTLTPFLDSYLKIKMRDKPKDTLLQIQHKKKLFLNYAILDSKHKHQNSIIQDENFKRQFNRSKQEFPQFTFKKCLPATTVLIVTIIPSKHCKCNISVRNLRGEVIKYYPNVFTTKKEGKVMKLIAEYSNPILIVKDYSNFESNLKAVISMLSVSSSIYYCIININKDIEDFKEIQQKLNQKHIGIIKFKDGILEIFSGSIVQLQKQGRLSEIKQFIQKKQFQQAQFLQIFRGKRSEQNRLLAFDMIGVNLWLQYKIQRHLVCYKIIQMFHAKQETIRSTTGQGEQNLTVIQHTPKRMLYAQNCIQCLADNPGIKKPKRTYLTCLGCSILRQKPIYLCRLCLGKFHQNPDVHTFKRNQKRRKLKRCSKKKKSLASKNQVPEQELQNRDNTDLQNSENSIMRMVCELNDYSMGYLAKITEQINQGRLDAAEFQLKMLLNTLAARKLQIESSSIQPLYQLPG